MLVAAYKLGEGFESEVIPAKECRVSLGDNKIVLKLIVLMFV
jgi:hypothetical protein